MLCSPSHGLPCSQVSLQVHYCKQRCRSSVKQQPGRLGLHSLLCHRLSLGPWPSYFSPDTQQVFRLLTTPENLSFSSPSWNGREALLCLTGAWGGEIGCRLPRSYVFNRDGISPELSVDADWWMTGEADNWNVLPCSQWRFKIPQARATCLAVTRDVREDSHRCLIRGGKRSRCLLSSSLSPKCHRIDLPPAKPLETPLQYLIQRIPLLAGYQPSAPILAHRGFQPITSWSKGDSVTSRAELMLHPNAGSLRHKSGAQNITQALVDLFQYAREGITLTCMATCS